MRRSPREAPFAGAVTLATLATMLGACGGAKPPPVEIKHIGTPGGVWFDEACTPTGPETCGNAVDDNCNGLIDEGCGIANGKVQFEVAWGEPTAKVELSVSDPQGDRLDGAHRLIRSGLRLDRACPEDGCQGRNVDNVVFDGESPMPGQYTVSVRLVDPGHAPLPLKVRFGWRVGNRVASTTFKLAEIDEKKDFSFEI